MVNLDGFYFSSIFQIIDEKSLIKKYQREISCLKEELDQLKSEMLVGVSHEEIIVLKQQVVFNIALKICIFPLVFYPHSTSVLWLLLVM